MEQNTLQLNVPNNVHESDFSEFIGNGLQQTNVIQVENSSSNFPYNNNLNISSNRTDNNLPTTNTPVNSSFNFPGFLTYEIPGYDVIFIPKLPQPVTSKNFNMPTFLNTSPTVNPPQLNQLNQQSYVYGTSGGSSVNAINTLNANVYDNNLQPQQNSLAFNESFNNHKNLRG